MRWRALFSKVEDMSPAEVKEYINRRSGTSFQLVDVRQPGEYAGGHLPGALLIPLRELPGRLTELDPRQPTIVYCAVGGRSKAAAQFMQGKGFAEVYNMPGGIKAWNGQVAAGPEQIDLVLFSGDGEYADGAALAYAMEEGLQQFYRRLMEQSTDERERSLLNRLASFEDLHKFRLLKEFQRKHGPDAALPGMPTAIMEGGRRIDDYLQGVAARLRNPTDILDLAMSLETQALDLYSRMARNSKKPEARDFFQSMADEENGHLSYLAEELDRLLAARAPQQGA